MDSLRTVALRSHSGRVHVGPAVELRLRERFPDELGFIQDNHQLSAHPAAVDLPQLAGPFGEAQVGKMTVQKRETTQQRQLKRRRRKPANRSAVPTPQSGYACPCSQEDGNKRQQKWRHARRGRTNEAQHFSLQKSCSRKKRRQKKKEKRKMFRNLKGKVTLFPMPIEYCGAEKWSRAVYITNAGSRKETMLTNNCSVFSSVW